MSKAGRVYLGSSRESFAPMVARALRDLGSAAPRVAVSYAAVADSPDAARSMAALFERSFEGATVERFTLPGEPGAMPEREAQAVIARADIIFLGGGDPVLGARILTASGADAWLREARARGASLLGVSAGSMMLCAYWASWPDDPPADAPFHGASLVRCAAVVDDLVVDCHAEEDDWNELVLIADLLRASGHKPRLRGLPTGSGVVVGAGGALEIVGDVPFEISV